MIVDKKRRIVTKISKKALITMFLIGCLALPVIGGIELVRSAGARPASDKGWIIYARGKGGDKGIWIMDADGESAKQLTKPDGHNGQYDDEPAWSPDGKQIAFACRIDSDTRAIFVMNADGSNIRQLTDGASDGYPTWSPDGKQIAFGRCIFEKNNLIGGGIYVISLDGAGLRKLLDIPPPSFFGGLDWSPDGRITFYWRRGARPQIWIVDSDGDNAKMLYDWGYFPAWSPDGKRIAFSSQEAALKAGRAGSDIYVMNADGSNVLIVTEPNPSTKWHPDWSPDGAKIVFSSDPNGDWDIYVMNADGSHVQQLTNTIVNELWPDWTAFSYAVEPAGKLKATWGKIKALLR